MLVGLLWNHWSFLVLFSIIHFGCWLEYFNLLEKIYLKKYHLISRLGFMIAGFGLMLTFCHHWQEISGYLLKENLPLIFSIPGFILMITGIFKSKISNLKLYGATALGWIYISLCWGLMLDLYGRETGNPLLYKESTLYLVYFPLFTIGCMWINDTMAYIVGSFIGRTPLSKISPKKTWEGTIGGIILSALIMGYIGYMFDEWFVFGQSFMFWVVLALIAAIMGTLGDLLESKLKRMAAVKDSGNIMPGHGGFLDRFDSLLLATPFVWLYVQLIDFFTT